MQNKQIKRLYDFKIPRDWWAGEKRGSNIFVVTFMLRYAFAMAYGTIIEMKNTFSPFCHFGLFWKVKNWNRKKTKTSVNHWKWAFCHLLIEFKFDSPFKRQKKNETTFICHSFRPYRFNRRKHLSFFMFFFSFFKIWKNLLLLFTFTQFSLSVNSLSHVHKLKKDSIKNTEPKPGLKLLKKNKSSKMWKSNEVKIFTRFQ